MEKITDPARFAELGVFLAAALIVSGKILSMGNIPTRHTLAHWLRDAVK